MAPQTHGETMATKVNPRGHGRPTRTSGRFKPPAEPSWFWILRLTPADPWSQLLSAAAPPSSCSSSSSSSPAAAAPQLSDGSAAAAQRFCSSAVRWASLDLLLTTRWPWGRTCEWNRSDGVLTGFWWSSVGTRTSSRFLLPSRVWTGFWLFCCCALVALLRVEFWPGSD